MALVTRRAAVHVAPDALVIRIRLALRMAVRAHEDGVIRGIGVAIAAGARATVRHGEPGMVKDSAKPRGSVMTRLAGCGKSCGDVIRVIRVLVIDLVARITVGRNVGVIVVDVTAGARHRLVRPCQWERR